MIETKYGLGIIIRRFDFDLCLVKHHNKPLPVMEYIKDREIKLLELK